MESILTVSSSPAASLALHLQQDSLSDPVNCLTTPEHQNRSGHSHPPPTLTQLEYEAQVGEEVDRLDLEPVVTEGMCDLQPTPAGPAVKVDEHLALLVH